jgi:ParB-like chromosome segregation protein Spo0J
VEALSINQIKLNRRNSRTHSAKQIRQIANSIIAFGFTNPLLVTQDGTLIAGEGRYKAAQLLGLAKVPVIVLAGLSPARQRALAIADNKIAENAGWDRERLAIERRRARRYWPFRLPGEPPRPLAPPCYRQRSFFVAEIGKTYPS